MKNSEKLSKCVGNFRLGRRSSFTQLGQKAVLVINSGRKTFMGQTFFSSKRGCSCGCGLISCHVAGITQQGWPINLNYFVAQANKLKKINVDRKPTKKSTN